MTFEETLEDGMDKLMADVKSLTDAQLASTCRLITQIMNELALECQRRELIVSYRIKDGLKADGLTNPRIIVSVMVEVA